MSPEEQLDEARAKEAVREMEERNTRFSFLEAATIAARKAREGWTPPEPVDPDLLAFREWAAKDWAELYPAEVDDVQRGKRDGCNIAKAYLAGARMARGQERERARWLVDYAVALETFRPGDSTSSIACAASTALAKYRGEA